MGRPYDRTPAWEIRHLIIFTVMILACSNAKSQNRDTLVVTLPQADSVFLRNNLFLLSQQFNIDANQALILQARVYPNPVFTVDLDIYDKTNEKPFNIDKGGQKAFIVEQLILLGGKRHTQIDIAKQNKSIAESEFADLLRNLQLELHNTFFQLRQQRNVLEKYGRQLELLDTLITSYDLQARRGNIPMKDVIRLKSVYLKINNEKSNLAADHAAEMKKIQMLLQTPQYILPVITSAFFDQFIISQSYEELLSLAVASRPDLKIAAQETDLSTLNLKLQRQLGIPDVVARGTYDQRGGAFVNQYNGGLSIPIPLWNRNRGNIKAATYYQKSAATFQIQKRMEVETEVQEAWRNLLRSAGEYAKVKSIYTDDFEEVFQGVNTNFKRRNITILEYVDFFEAYNESLTEFERVKTQFAIATRQINFVTATKVF